MAPEAGQYALILALTVAVAQSVLPMVGAWRRDGHLMLFGAYAAVAQLLLTGIAFVLLARAFVMSDFSLLVVASNSNAAMPAHFRLSATWGNHEGSLLLWVLILALFGAALAVFGRAMTSVLKAQVLAVQGLIAAAFLGLTIFTSNRSSGCIPRPTQGWN